jgi:hypothetical protein
MNGLTIKNNIMSKSFITMEQKACPITGKVWDNGTLILDKRMKDKFERNTVTGWEFSPEAREQLDKGMMAFVEIDEGKSEKLPNGTITPSGAYRLGAVAWVKREVAYGELELPREGLNMIFCETAIIDHFQKMHDYVEKKDKNKG